MHFRITMPAVRRLPHVLSAVVRQRGTSCSPASTAAAASGHAVHHHSHSHNCASAIFGPGGGLCRHGVHQLSGASSQSDGETVFEVDASKVKYGPGALAEVGNAATKVFQMKRVHDIDITRSALFTARVCAGAPRPAPPFRSSQCINPFSFW